MNTTKKQDKTLMKLKKSINLNGTLRILTGRNLKKLLFFAPAS